MSKVLDNADHKKYMVLHILQKLDVISQDKYNELIITYVI